VIDIPAVFRGRRQLVLLAVLAATVAGCGGKSASTTAAGTTTAAATTAVDQQPPPTATTALPPPPAKQVAATRAQLAKATLTPAQVGSDWKLAPFRGAAVVSEWCNRKLAEGIAPYADSEAAFTQKFGSTITQQLTAYPGDGAKRVLADLRDVLQNCSSWQSTPEPGRTVDYTVSKIEKGKLPGDDAVALRVRSSNVFGNIEVRRSTVAVMTRRGPVVDLVMQTANVGLDQPAAPVLQLAARADRRLATSG
jgi:hypothetical protein